MSDEPAAASNSLAIAERRTWPSEGLERVSACPVCGSSQRSPAHASLTDEVFFCAPGTWEMHQCDACSSCYLDPRPNPATIHLAYGQYFTHADAEGIAERNATGRLAQLRRSWANGYRNWRYGTQSLPASRLGVVAAFVIPRLRRAADSRMRFIPRRAEGRRLLDVGAGNGTYLLHAQSAGWQVIGVEPDASAVAAARRAGLDVRQGGIESLSETPESLDVITLNHVIEHVHDPRAVLQKAFELLRPGGLLYIETPCATSYGHMRFGRHWRGLEPPRHLVLFTWSSLETLLRDVGFNRIRRLTRSDVYPTLARKSRTIKQGGNPEAAPRTPLVIRLIDAAQSVHAIIDYRRAEFITLIAEKH